MHQQAGTLSGGEQQMLALGRALMAGPKLLLLDEPSLGLAPLIVQQIFRTLADLKRSGVTMLLVEQNISAALDLADRAYVLRTGEIALVGAGARAAARTTRRCARRIWGRGHEIGRDAMVPPPQSGGGGPAKPVEGARIAQALAVLRGARPLHHASHGPPPPFHGGGAAARYWSQRA